jgi:hypothetical protein
MPDPCRHETTRDTPGSIQCVICGAVCPKFTESDIDIYGRAVGLIASVNLANDNELASEAFYLEKFAGDRPDYYGDPDGSAILRQIIAYIRGTIARRKELHKETVTPADLDALQAQEQRSAVDIYADRAVAQIADEEGKLIAEALAKTK